MLLLHAFHVTAVLTSAASPADTLTCKSHQVSDLKGSFLIYSAAHRIAPQPCQSTLVIALKTLTDRIIVFQPCPIEFILPKTGFLSA